MENQINSDIIYQIYFKNMGPLSNVELQGDKVLELLKTIEKDGNSAALIMPTKKRKRNTNNNKSKVTKKTKEDEEKADPSTFKDDLGHYVDKSKDERIKLPKEEGLHVIQLLVKSLIVGGEFPEEILKKKYLNVKSIIGGLSRGYFKESYIKKHKGFSQQIMDLIDEDTQKNLYDRYTDSRNEYKLQQEDEETE